MKKHLFIGCILFIISIGSHAETNNTFKELKTGPNSKFYISDAAFFKADGDKAAVFLPGFIFNKESWYFMAQALQQNAISSLAVNGKSADIVKAAIKKLKRKGYQDITLIGGSSGAAAILEALEREKFKQVSKVILLSPPRGTPIHNDHIQKLFVASQEERLFPTVESIFNNSGEPKKFTSFTGTAHAQFLFFGPHRNNLIQTITDFIMQ